MLWWCWARWWCHRRILWRPDRFCKTWHRRVSPPNSCNDSYLHHLTPRKTLEICLWIIHVIYMSYHSSGLSWFYSKNIVMLDHFRVCPPSNHDPLGPIFETWAPSRPLSASRKEYLWRESARGPGSRNQFGKWSTMIHGGKFRRFCRATSWQRNSENWNILELLNIATWSAFRTSSRMITEYWLISGSSWPWVASSATGRLRPATHGTTAGLLLLDWSTLCLCWRHQNRPIRTSSILQARSGSGTREEAFRPSYTWHSPLGYPVSRAAQQVMVKAGWTLFSWLFRGELGCTTHTYPLETTA